MGSPFSIGGDGGITVTGPEQPPAPPAAPPRNAFATRAISQDEIEEFANSQFVVGDIELLSNADMIDALLSLNEALVKKAGTLWNPNGVTIANFNYQFFTYSGQRYSVENLLCFFESKQTGKKELSNVHAWPAGRFWAICTELVNLAR